MFTLDGMNDGIPGDEDIGFAIDLAKGEASALC